jgi:hypothetical protein
MVLDERGSPKEVRIPGFSPHPMDQWVLSQKQYELFDILLDQCVQKGLSKGSLHKEW